MNTKTIRSSILDCLLDDDDDAPGEPGYMSETEFVASVARDLEMLLNTRNVHKKLTGREGNDQIQGRSTSHAHLIEVDRSVAMLGLPDFSGLSLASANDRQLLVQAVQQAITTFEPRLGDVVVRLPENARASASLQFSITARLVVPGMEAPVAFKALFQSVNHSFAVSPTEPGV